MLNLNKNKGLPAAPPLGSGAGAFARARVPLYMPV